MTHWKSVAAVSGALVLALGMGTPAFAAPHLAAESSHLNSNASTMSQDERNDLAEFWKTHGVNAADRSALLAKLSAGQLPDSMTSATPVAVSTGRNGAFRETLQTYADGSVVVLQIQDQPGSVGDPTGMGTNTSTAALNSAGVTGCAISSGSGYSNYDHCLVRGTDGTLTNWFYAYWTLVQGGQNDQLRKTENPGQACSWPWNCDTPYRSAYVMYESYSTSAGATYTGRYSGALGSGTIYLSITVGGNTYYPTWTVL